AGLRSAGAGQRDRQRDRRRRGTRGRAHAGLRQRVPRHGARRQATRGNGPDHARGSAARGRRRPGHGQGGRMNVYYYRLLLPNGRVKSGIAQLSVEHDSSARLWLEKTFEATVVHLQKLPGWLAETQRSLAHLFSPNIRPPELAGMLRDMAVMTSSGIPVLEALRAVSQEVGTGRASNAARIARNLLDELDAGAGMSEAFNRYPDTFPETVRNLIMIGDETGSMDHMLSEAADHVERVARMSAHTRQALTYPGSVFTAIFAAGGFWIYYVIPNLTSLFKQMNADLPPLTIAVIAFAEWFTGNIVGVLVGMAAT